MGSETTPEMLAMARRIVAGLSNGEKLHVLRLGNAPPEGLPRKSGWRAVPVMRKGLSDWADYHAGTESLTPLGLAVHQALQTQEPDHG